MTFIGSVQFTCGQQKTQFSHELQKVAEGPLDWSQYLKTRKCFTQLQRHHCFNAQKEEFFLKISTFMRACFDFLWQKN